MKNFDHVRVIHTNLFSNIAYDILRSVNGRMSDDIYENTFRMTKYWMFSDIERAIDNEVIIKISTDYYCRTYVNGFYDMSDDEVLQWYGKKVKHVMKLELETNGCSSKCWSRSNTSILRYDEDMTVADVYYVYEKLMGRANVEAKYPAEIVYKVQSSPLSKEIIEAENIRNNKINAITAERDAKLKEAEDNYKAECRAREEAYNTLRNAILAEANAKIEAA